MKIAERVGFSEAAVRRRVDNLIRSGVILRFTLEVNEPQQAGAITCIAVSPSVPTIEVSKKIKGVPGVETIFETTGPFEIAVILKGSNIADLNKSVEAIRRIAGVLSTNTTIILRSVR